MASPPAADLRKIGEEGFALIDKFCRPTRGTGGTDAEPAMNSKDAAVHYGGIASVHYPKTRRTWGATQVPNGEMPEPTMNRGERLLCVNNTKPQTRWGRPLKP